MVEIQTLIGDLVSKGLNCNDYNEIDGDRYMIECMMNAMMMRAFVRSDRVSNLTRGF
jgi:hypothetical protein